MIPSVAANKFFESAQRSMCNLWSRWQDEKEYENINDYMIPIKPLADQHGVVLVKMSKRPFGVIFTVDQKTFHLTVTSRSYQYKRIKDQ